MKFSLLSVSSLLIPLVASTPLLNVDIKISENTHGVTPNQQHALELNKSPAHMQEQIPGWVFIADKSFRARIHGNTFWNVKGTLKDEFPIEDFLFDPLLFTLDHPEDFKGDFKGTIGRGRIEVKWERSGATIAGRSPIGDFEISGTSEVDYSP